MSLQVDYSEPLTPTSGWKLKRNWGASAGPEYHAQIGLTHWSFAGFLVVVTIGDHTLGQVSISPNDLSPIPSQQEDGEATEFCELMPDGTLRRIAVFAHGVSVSLHPDGSLRQVIFDGKSNQTTVELVPWDPATGNWTFPFVTIANVSETSNGLAPHSHGAGQGSAFLVMDVEIPSEPGHKLLILNEPGNNPNFTRFHLGAVPWSTSEAVESDWLWTAAPGGVWETTQCNISMENAGDDSQIFTDTCIVDPDGSIDRCGGHFPCAANKAMTVKGHLIYGFNGEGWHGAQANQWLHYDAITGLFLGQFGTVNGIHESKYSDDGWAAPGAAGNAFSCTLVTTTSGDVYLYHNDESAHGGVHRWRLHGLDDVERVRIALAT
jgi:hypothetical protein